MQIFCNPEETTSNGGHSQKSKETKWDLVEGAHMKVTPVKRRHDGNSAKNMKWLND